MRTLVLLVILVTLGCAGPLRSWTGQPTEQFPGDRAECYQEPIFEECMHQRGWKEYRGREHHTMNLVAAAEPGTTFGRPGTSGKKKGKT